MSRSMTGFGAPAAALLAIALVAGCSGSGGLDTGATSSGSPSGAATAASPTDPATGSASPTAAPSSSVTATVDPAVTAVRADFGLYRAAYVKAVRTRDEHVPDVIRYTTARQQAVIRRLVQFLRGSNVVLRGQARDWLKDITPDGRRATLRYCQFDSSTYFVYAATGRKYQPVTDTWKSFRVLLTHRDNRWQVDSIAQLKFSCKGAR
jgi:hypothetical protein